MNPPAPDQRRLRLLTAVVCALAPLPYLGQFGGGFLDWDDGRFISANPLFQGPIGAYVGAALTRIQFDAYHPLHLLSYLPDRLLWPAQPAGFRLLNLLILGAAAALLFRLLARHAAIGAAAFAALAFAWHPVVTESASWISARKDLLCLLLVIGVLHREDRPDQEPSARPDLWSLLLTVAAILTKSAALVLPVFIFAWQRWAREQPPRIALLRALPAGVIAVITSLLVALLWRSHQMLLTDRPLPAPIDVAGTIGFYLGHVVWPARLSPLYPAVPDGFVAGAALALVAFVMLALCWRRLPPPARFALVAFAGALLPVANLAPLYFRFADRYQLLALLALAWPLAAAATWALQATRRRGLLIAGAALLLLAEGASSFRQSRHWRQSSALWTHAVRAQPRALFAFLKLGELRSREANWNEASRAYLRAIELGPDSALGFIGLFTSVAERQQASGALPSGTAQAWRQRLPVAIGSPPALLSLMSDTRAAGCAPCAQTLLWLSLRLQPRPDAELLDLAARALDSGLAGEAVILLREVKDRNHARLRALGARLPPAHRPAP